MLGNRLECALLDPVVVDKIGNYPIRGLTLLKGPSCACLVELKVVEGVNIVETSVILSRDHRVPIGEYNYISVIQRRDLTTLIKDVDYDCSVQLMSENIEYLSSVYPLEDRCDEEIKLYRTTVFLTKEEYQMVKGNMNNGEHQWSYLETWDVVGGMLKSGAIKDSKLKVILYEMIIRGYIDIDTVS